MKKTRQSLIEMKIKIVRILLFALPLIFVFAPTQGFAAADDRTSDVSSKPLIVAKLQAANRPNQEVRKQAVPLEAAQCAPSERIGEAQVGGTAVVLDEEPAPLDIGKTDGSLADDHVAGTSETEVGPSHDLGRDTLQLSLETRSPAVDAPQSCKPE